MLPCSWQLMDMKKVNPSIDSCKIHKIILYKFWPFLKKNYLIWKKILLDYLKYTQKLRKLAFL